MIMENSNIHCRLLQGIMLNDVDIVSDILFAPDFDRGIVEDIQLFDQKVPYYFLTACHKIVLEELFSNSDETILNLRRRCDVILALWEKFLGRSVDLKLDFSPLSKVIASWRADFSMADILGRPYECLHSLGYDYNECEFCYAIMTYKPDLLEKHIQLKTNPDVWISSDCPCGTIPDEDDPNCAYFENGFDHVDLILFDAASISYLYHLYYQIIEDLWKTECFDQQIEDLIIAAAYQNLYDRLVPIVAEHKAKKKGGF